MDTADTIEKNLPADIEALRQQYPGTQDLYREVCAVMFFRYGMTPTTNKLYQLVRKGSMSAPAEALNRFWENLREKSRVTIDQPDLPDAIRVAAGDLVATLWRSARADACGQLTSLQTHAKAMANLAEETVKKAVSDRDLANAALSAAKEELRLAHEQIDLLRHEITSLKSSVSAAASQLQTARDDLLASQDRLDACRVDFAAELEKLRQSAMQSEERMAGAETRALVEIDRERMSAAQARKALEAALTEKNAAEGRHKDEARSLQKLLADQGHKNGIQEGELRAMAANQEKANLECDRLREQLGMAREEISLLRAKPKTREAAKAAPQALQEQAPSGKQTSIRRRTKG